MAINGYSDAMSPEAQKLVTGGTFTAPSQWWFALYEVTPDADGTNLSEEFFFPSYTRVRIYGSSEVTLPKWVDPGLAGDDFLVSNEQAVYFPTATEDWGTLNGVVIMNSNPGSLAENMVFGADVGSPAAITLNMTVVFLAGAAKLTTRNL